MKHRRAAFAASQCFATVDDLQRHRVIVLILVVVVSGDANIGLGRAIELDLRNVALNLEVRDGGCGNIEPGFAVGAFGCHDFVPPTSESDGDRADDLGIH